MSELFHECGVVAVYHLASGEVSPLCPLGDRAHAARLVPRMLLDIQNRGQLAAGITSYSPSRDQILDTHKDVGTVNEVFFLSHREKNERLMEEYDGFAAIGHVRYATCGKDDRSYAQPFERHHLEKRKWFSFAFNGQLADYEQLKQRVLAEGDNHLARETDTEIMMHFLSREFSGDRRPSLVEALRNVAREFDGAWSLALLNARGEMVVARDPLGIKPMCWAREGALFAAASESVALLNLGFRPESIESLQPGQCIVVGPDRLEVQTFAPSPRRAHCFFEWIYFANVASTLDNRSVYLTRTRLGEELARSELASGRTSLENAIVVPVPDTSKAAADAMAYKLGIPSREGLIRNRYSGRTFIEGSQDRRRKAESKYTPLREVLEGKRVFLVEDSIVRSTTMQVLLERIRKLGGAREIHVRVACPPIIAPCYYGIDMSRLSELFAPKFLASAGDLNEETQAEMARALGADSLRFLPVQAIARAVGFDSDQLCQACITGEYPTPCGQQTYDTDVITTRNGKDENREFESNRAGACS